MTIEIKQQVAELKAELANTLCDEERKQIEAELKALTQLVNN